MAAQGVSVIHTGIGMLHVVVADGSMLTVIVTVDIACKYAPGRLSILTLMLSAQWPPPSSKRYSPFI